MQRDLQRKKLELLSIHQTSGIETDVTKSYENLNALRQEAQIRGYDETYDEGHSSLDYTRTDELNFRLQSRASDREIA
jgi:hypothetical protein